MSFRSDFNDTLDGLIVGRLGDSVIISGGDTYPVRSVTATTVTGLVENRHIVIDGIETLAPTFACQSSDITNVVYGSMVEDGLIKYKVKSLQPDGTGMTILLLEKQ